MCLNLIGKPNVLQLKIEVIYLSFILLKKKKKTLMFLDFVLNKICNLELHF